MTQSMQQLSDDEEALREQIRELSPEQRKTYYRLEKQRLKDPDTYATLNYIFLGGLHHFYLGRIARGLFNLLLSLSGIVVWFFMPLLGLALIVFVIVIELPQLFKAQRVIYAHNNQTMRDTLSEVRAMR